MEDRESGCFVAARLKRATGHPNSHFPIPTSRFPDIQSLSCHVANLLFIGNPNTVHDRKVMRWFAHRPGHKVFFMSYPAAAERFTAAQQADFAQMGIHYLGPIQHHSPLKFMQNRRQARQVQALIRQHGIQCVTILYLAPGALWAQYRQQWKTPVLLWAYGTDVNDSMARDFAAQGLRARQRRGGYVSALSQADAVLAYSRPLLEQLWKWQPSLQRAQVLRSGVEVRRMMASHAPLPASLQGKPFLLFPRYMQPVYQHELSLRAIALLPQEVRAKYEMVFLDAGSTQAAYVEQVRKEMATVDARFTWLDAQPQESLWALLKAASLVVMHPRTDGTPITALECMVCATPLVLGTASYERELFDGVPRLHQDDPRELAEAILRFAGQDKSAAWLRALQERACAEVNADLEMERLEALYLSLAQARQ